MAQPPHSPRARSAGIPPMHIASTAREEALALGNYVNLKAFTHYIEGLKSEPADSELGKLYADYIAGGKERLDGYIADRRNDFINAFVKRAGSDQSALNSAHTRLELVDTTIATQLAKNPDLAQDPRRLFDGINAAFNFGYALDDKDMNEMEREQKQALIVRQMAAELAAADAKGGEKVVYRLGGLGIGVPAGYTVKSLSEADAMGAASGFLARAQSEGLIHLSPAKLAEQQAILGTISKIVLEQNSLRSVINVGINGVASGVPEVVSAFLKGSKELTPANLKDFMDSSEAWKDLGNDAKEAALTFAEKMGDSSGRLLYEVTSVERVRICNEIWQLMLNPGNASYMGHSGEIKKEYLDQLPDSVKNRLMAIAAADKPSDPGEKPAMPTMRQLAELLDPSIRPLATMYTGSQAHASAQLSQEPYTMSYHDTSVWGAMGGQPAANMRKYARETVRSQPEEHFTVRASAISPSYSPHDNPLPSHANLPPRVRNDDLVLPR